MPNNNFKERKACIFFWVLCKFNSDPTEVHLVLTCTWKMEGCLQVHRPAAVFIPGAAHRWPWRQCQGSCCRGCWTPHARTDEAHHSTGLVLQSMPRIAQMVALGRSSSPSPNRTLQMYVCTNKAVRPVLRGPGIFCRSLEEGVEWMFTLEPITLPTPLAVKASGCGDEIKFAWRSRRHNKYRIKSKYFQNPGIIQSEFSESELLSTLAGLHRRTVHTHLRTQM